MVWVRLPVYFYKRNNTYYFSRLIPSDLQHRFKKLGLKHPCEQNQNQKQPNLLQRYLIGSSDIGTVSGSLKRSNKNSNHFFQCLVKISDKVIDHF